MTKGIAVFEGLPDRIAGAPVAAMAPFARPASALAHVEPTDSGPVMRFATSDQPILSVPILNGKSWVIRMGAMGDVMAGLDDNSHFASRLTGPAFFDRLLGEGEDAFLESLTPRFVKDCAERFGGPIIRQGDLYFTRFSPRAVDGRYSYVKHERFFLNATRHVLDDGALLELKAARKRTTHRRWPSFEGRRVLVVVNGTVTAPDHPAVKFSEPHICVRTEAFVPTSWGGGD